MRSIKLTVICFYNPEVPEFSIIQNAEASSFSFFHQSAADCSGQSLRKFILRRTTVALRVQHYIQPIKKARSLFLCTAFPIKLKKKTKIYKTKQKNKGKLHFNPALILISSTFMLPSKVKNIPPEIC